MLSVVATLALVVVTTVPARAQPTVNVGRLIAGLVNVNISDIDLTDVQVVNVEDSLNQNQIEILNNVLNNNTILSNNQNNLNNLLRNADIISNNDVVVGVDILSGDIFILSP